MPKPVEVTKEAKEIVEKLSDFVNPFGADYKGFAYYLTHNVHRTLQQNLMKLFICCIHEWSKIYHDPSQIGMDKRNEATCRVSSEIMEKMDAKNGGLCLPLV